MNAHEGAEASQTDLQQEELALRRLVRLHAEVAEARRGANRWVVPLLIGFGMGVIALVIVTAPLAILMEAHGSSDSPVPGLIGMTAFLAAMVVATKFFRRRTRRRAGVVVSRAEAALQGAVEEISRRLPAWTERMGGEAALRDSARVNDALILARRTAAFAPLGTAPAAPPTAADTGTVEAAEHLSVQRKASAHKPIADELGTRFIEGESRARRRLLVLWPIVVIGVPAAVFLGAPSFVKSMNEGISTTASGVYVNPFIYIYTVRFCMVVVAVAGILLMPVLAWLSPTLYWRQLMRRAVSKSPSECFWRASSRVKSLSRRELRIDGETYEKLEVGRLLSKVV